MLSIILRGGFLAAFATIERPAKGCSMTLRSGCHM